MDEPSDFAKIIGLSAGGCTNLLHPEFIELKPASRPRGPIRTKYAEVSIHIGIILHYEQRMPRKKPLIFDASWDVELLPAAANFPLARHFLNYFKASQNLIGSIA